MSDKPSEAVVECTFAIKAELGNPFSKPKDRLGNAEKILQQLLDEQLAEKWTSISEAMPLDNKVCLVCGKGRILGIVTYNGMYSSWSHHSAKNINIVYADQITHWMYLPEAPHV